MVKKWFSDNKWLLVIILIASFFRVYRLDYLELFGDELDAGYQSYSLLSTGRDYKGHLLPSYAQSFSEWRAPGLMYAMMPFIKVFGLNEWGVRSCPAFLGIVSLLGFYFLLKEIGVKEKVARWSIFLLAISPWHIQYSRAAYELTLMSSLILWAVYFLVKSIKNDKNLLVVFSGILFSLAIYTYNTANILVPLLCLASLIIWRAKKEKWFILIAAGAIFCSPLIYQIFFGHAADRFGTVAIFNNKEIVAEIDHYRNAGKNTLLSKIFYNKLTVSRRKILFNYFNAFGDNFLFKEGDVTFRHSLHQVGNLYWIELPLIVWGLVVLVRKNNKSKGDWFLLSLLLIAPTAASLTFDGYNHASRLFLLVFPLSYLAAYGLNNINRYLIFPGLIILFFEFSFYQYYYWNFYRNESWRWWHTGYKEAMQYVAANKNNYSKVVMDNTYEPALIRYLFWSKSDPKMIFSLEDKMDKKVGSFNGFCLDEKICFVDFQDKFKIDNLSKGVLYLISQERNVGGDWDWSKNPPEGIEVQKTVRNYDGTPIFYLVTKR